MDKKQAVKVKQGVVALLKDCIECGLYRSGGCGGMSLECSIREKTVKQHSFEFNTVGLTAIKVVS